MKLPSLKERLLERMAQNIVRLGPLYEECDRFPGDPFARRALEGALIAIAEDYSRIQEIKDRERMKAAKAPTVLV